MPLASAGKVAREGAPSQKTCRAPALESLAEGVFVHRRSVITAALALLLALPPVGLAADVHVRVEGQSRTLFGAAEPRLESANAMLALEAASARGEFYYHITQTSFGPYVDRIGRLSAGGSSGWVFKVNGESPPVGADQVVLREGDRVLWYWAEFGPTGGPPTLLLQRRAGGCYRVMAQDDQGRMTPAIGATLRIGSRRVRTQSARACPGPHRALVRAVRAGSVRSNAVR
jgi:uncharacterized protein DUF4430